jgi:hypothetical protein
MDSRNINHVSSYLMIVATLKVNYLNFVHCSELSSTPPRDYKGHKKIPTFGPLSIEFYALKSDINAYRTFTLLLTFYEPVHIITCVTKHF